MRVSRAELLKVLGLVKPGLEKREGISQGTCFVFSEGKVRTFNKDIYCCMESPLKIEGAVRAKNFLDLLSKLQDDELDITTDPEKGLGIKCKGQRKSTFRMESEIKLPYPDMEETEWKELNKEFIDAVKMAAECAHTDEKYFTATCIHITPDCVESSDSQQIFRFPIDTGVSRPLLVSAASMNEVVKETAFSLGFISEADAWLKFKSSDGLLIAVRRHLDDYPVDLGMFFGTEGMQTITLPGALKDEVDMASIFSTEDKVDSTLKIVFKDDGMIIHGTGPGGDYKCRKEVKYDGPEITFRMEPKLLAKVAKMATDVSVSKEKIYINAGRFQFVACTTVPKVAT